MHPIRLNDAFGIHLAAGTIAGFGASVVRSPSDAAIVTASMRPSAGVGIVEIEKLKVGKRR